MINIGDVFLRAGIDVSGLQNQVNKVKGMFGGVNQNLNYGQTISTGINQSAIPSVQNLRNQVAATSQGMAQLNVQAQEFANRVNAAGGATGFAKFVADLNASIKPAMTLTSTLRTGFQAVQIYHFAAGLRLNVDSAIDLSKVLGEIAGKQSALKKGVGIFKVMDVALWSQRFAASWREVNVEVGKFYALTDRVYQAVERIAFPGMAAAMGGAMAGGMGGAGGAMSGAMGGAAGGAGMRPTYQNYNLGGLLDPGRGVEAYVEMEKVLNRFEAVNLDATAGEIQSVKDEVKKLGIETSKAPLEIANTANALSTLGFTSGQVVDSLGGVVRMAEASGESLELVGTIVAATVNQFGLAASDAQKVGDMMVATGAESAASVSSLGESLKYAGATATAANQSLEDTLTALGLLSNAGLNGSIAGTSYAAAIRNLQIAVAGLEPELKSAQKEIRLTNSELENLGTSSLQNASTAAGGGDAKTRALGVLGLTRESLLDSKGELKSLIDIIPLLKGRVEELKSTAEGAAQVPLLMNAIFGSEGGRAIQLLLGQTEEQIYALSNAIENSAGYSAKAAEKMLQGLSGTMQLLSGSMATTANIVGSMFAPAINYILGETLSLINAFNSLPYPLQALIVLFSTIAPIVLFYYRGLRLVEAAKGAMAAITRINNLLMTEEGRITLKNKVAKMAAAAQEKVLNVVKAVGTRLQKLYNLEYSISAIKLDLYNVKLAIGATAQAIFNMQMSTTIKTVKLMGMQLLAAAKIWLIVIAAFATWNELTRKSEGAKLAEDIRKSTKSLQEFYAVQKTANAMTEFDKQTQKFSATWQKMIYGLATGQISEAFNTLTRAATQSFDRITEAWSDRGWVEGIRQSIQEINVAFADLFAPLRANTTVRSEDILSDYGANLSAITAKQRGAQQAMLALSDQLDMVNERYQEGNKLVSASPIRRATEEWKTAAKERIATIEEEIKVLNEHRNSSGYTANQKKLIEENVLLLERQKKALQASSVADIAKVKTLEQVNNELERQNAQLTLDTQNQILIAKQKQFALTATAQETEDKIFAIEQAGRQKRLDAINAALKDLETTAFGISDEQVAEIEKRKQALVQESLQIQNQSFEAAMRNREQLERRNLENVKNAADEATAAIEQSQNERILAVKQAIAAGKITEEQGQAQIARIGQEGIQERIEATQTELQALEASYQKKEISEKDYTNTRKQLIGEITQLNIQAADAEIADQKRAKEAIIESIEATQNERILAVKQAIAANVLTEEQGQAQIAEIQQQATQQRIQAANAELTKLEGAYARGEISEKDYLKTRKELVGEISKLTIDALEGEIEAQERVKRAAIASIEATQNERILAVKRAIADNVMTTEQGEAEIAKAQQQNIQQRLQLIDAEVSKLEAAYASKKISEKDYQETRKELMAQVTKLSIEAAEAEIAAQERVKQAAIAAIELRITKQNQLNDAINAAAQEQIDSMKQVQSAQESQLSLMQAQENLNKVLAEGEIERATDKGAATEKEMKRSQKAAMEMLRAQQEQERQAASIAVAEAQVTEQKAEQARVQAQLNLQIAKQSGEVQKIIQAEMALAQAVRERVAAGKGVEQAQAASDNLGKRQAIEQKTLKAQQRNESEAASRQRAADSASAAESALEKQVEKLTKAYEKQSQVLEYRQQQIASITETRKLETEGIKAQLEALEEQGNLAKAESDNAIATKELQLAGLGADASDDVRKAIELEIAAIRKQSAQEEIELNRQKLELQLEEKKINTEIAAQEAEINRIKAEQNILQAKYNLEKAKTEKNEQGVINAKAEIDIATRGLDIAQKREAMAQKAVANNEKSAATQRKINDLQSDTTAKQADAAAIQSKASEKTSEMASAQDKAADGAERQADALGKAADNAEKTADSAEKAADAAKSMASASSIQSVIWDERELKKQELEAAAKLADLAGDDDKAKAIKAQIEREKKAFELEDLKAELTSIQQRREQNRSEVANQMHMIDEMTRLTGGAGIDGKTGRKITVDAGAMKREKMQELQDRFGIDPMGGSGSGIEGLSNLITQAQMNVNTSPQMQEALAKSNRGVEDRLDTLNSNMERIASTPRSVTVNGSKDPGADLPGVLQAVQRAKM